LYNRLPHHGIDNWFPIEVLYNTTLPPVHRLHPFGWKAYVHIPDKARPSGSKLQPRVLEGILVGYTSSTKIYCIYIPDKRTIKNIAPVIFPNSKKQLTITLLLLMPRDSKNIKTESPTQAITPKIKYETDPVSEQLFRESEEIKIDNQPQRTSPKSRKIPGSFDDFSDHPDEPQNPLNSE
jgi:hypothetical protein